MYKLKRLNVVKVVEEDSRKEKLMSEGFELIEDEKSQGEGGINYSEMTIPDLQTLCKEKGLSGYSNLPKDDLVKFIEEKLALEGKK